MTRIARPARRAILLPILLAGLGGLVLAWAAPAAAVIELEGRTQATLGWAAAPPPVSAYLVQVSRNRGPFRSEGLASPTERKYVLRGAFGDRLVVRVAAIAPDGTQGPFSPRSEAIRFRRRSGSSGGGDDDIVAFADGREPAPVSVLVSGSVVEARDPGRLLDGSIRSLLRDGGRPGYALHFLFDPDAPARPGSDRYLGLYEPRPGALSFATRSLAVFCPAASGTGGLSLVLGDQRGLGGDRTEDALAASGLGCTGLAERAVAVSEASLVLTDSSRSALRSAKLEGLEAGLERFDAGFDSGMVEVRGCPASDPGCDPRREGFTLVANVTTVPEPAAALVAPLALAALALLARSRRARRA